MGDAVLSAVDQFIEQIVTGTQQAQKTQLNSSYCFVNKTNCADTRTSLAGIQMPAPSGMALSKSACEAQRESSCTPPTPPQLQPSLAAVWPSGHMHCER
jgi:hypothetical protein